MPLALEPVAPSGTGELLQLRCHKYNDISVDKTTATELVAGFVTACKIRIFITIPFLKQRSGEGPADGEKGYSAENTPTTLGRDRRIRERGLN